jgi:hypothetical protein
MLKIILLTVCLVSAISCFKQDKKEETAGPPPSDPTPSTTAGVYALKMDDFADYRRNHIPNYPFQKNNMGQFNSQDYPVACSGEGEAGVVPNWIKINEDQSIRYYFGIKKCTGEEQKKCYLDGKLTSATTLTAGPNSATYQINSEMIIITVPDEKDTFCQLNPPVGLFSLEREQFQHFQNSKRPFISFHFEPQASFDPGPFRRRCPNNEGPAHTIPSWIEITNDSKLKAYLGYNTDSGRNRPVCHMIGQIDREKGLALINNRKLVYSYANDTITVDLSARFFDDFNRPDGGLGNEWFIPKIFKHLDEKPKKPKIKNQMACGNPQSVMFNNTKFDNPSRLHLSLEFTAGSQAGHETYFLIGSSLNSSHEEFYAVGCDGGNNDNCMLAIHKMVYENEKVKGTQKFSQPLDIILTPQTTYKLYADLEKKNGNWEVVLSLKQTNNETIAMTSPIILDREQYMIHYLGFVTGRDKNIPTCVDNYRAEEVTR